MICATIASRGVDAVARSYIFNLAQGVVRWSRVLVATAMIKRELLMHPSRYPEGEYVIDAKTRLYQPLTNIVRELSLMRTYFITDELGTILRVETKKFGWVKSGGVALLCAAPNGFNSIEKILNVSWR